MKSYKIRVNKEIYDKIEHFKEKMKETDGKELSTPEAVSLMENLGEINIFNKKETNKFFARGINIKRINHNNHVTKKRTNRIIMEIGVPGLWKNKRGSNIDMLFLLMTLFVMGLFGFIAADFWGGLYDDHLEPGNIFNKTETAADIGAGVNTVIGNWDFVVPTLMVLGTVIVAILVYLNPIPAPFLIAGLIFIPIFEFFAFVLRTAYIDAIDSSASFTANLSLFPLTDHIMRLLPAYMLVFFVIILVVQYGRSRSSVQTV